MIDSVFERHKYDSYSLARVMLLWCVVRGVWWVVHGNHPDRS